MNHLLSALWFAAAGAAFATTNGNTPAIVEIGDERWLAREVVRETFADADWKERWAVEGNMTISAAKNRLAIAGDGGNPVATVWLKQPLPADVLIELKAGCEPPAENNAANLNLIVHARELDGQGYRFGRSGIYAEYHTIPNYIFTLTGGFQPGWARVRRDPGFNLLAEEKSTRSEVGRSYRIRVLIAGGRLRYWLDDRLIHDVRDPQPLPGGHFALRTWRSRVWWSDVRICAITPVPTTPGGTRK